MTDLSTLPWGLWIRQVGSVMRLEVRKSFLARRALWIYLLAGLPLLLISSMAASLDCLIARASSQSLACNSTASQMP